MAAPVYGQQPGQGQQVYQAGYGQPPPQGYQQPQYQAGQPQAQYAAQGAPHHTVPVQSAPSGYAASVSALPPSLHATQRIDYNEYHISKDERLNYESAAGKKYNDLWAAVLFVVVVLIFIIVGASAISNADFSSSGKTSAPRPTSSGASMCKKGESCASDIVAAIIVCGGVLGVVWAFIWNEIMKRYAAGIIHCMLISQLVVLGVATLASFAAGVVGMGILFLILTAIFAIYYFYNRRRIPFAAASIDIAVSALKNFPGPYFVSFGGAFVALAFGMFWIVSIVAIFDESSPSQGQIFLAVFIFYWVDYTVDYVVHTTVVGTMASWLFSPDPKAPTRNSLKRSMTTSFGSICFGSLVIAIARSIENAIERENGNPILLCIAHCLRAILEFLTKYAFVHVGIYGKPFIQSAKDTWTMLKSKGYTVLINDSFVGYVLFAGALLSGVLTGIIAFFWTVSSDSIATLGVVIATVVSIFITLLIVIIVLGTVDSAVATALVVFCEDPDAIMQNRPEHGQKFAAAAAEIIDYHDRRARQ